MTMMFLPKVRARIGRNQYDFQKFHIRQRDSSGAFGVHRLPKGATCALILKKVAGQLKDNSVLGIMIEPLPLGVTLTGHTAALM